MSRPLPDWLAATDPPIASHGHDGWIRKNLGAMGRVGQGFVVHHRKAGSGAHPALQVLLLLLSVLLINLVRDQLFLAVFGLAILLRVLILPRAKLLAVMATAAAAGLFSLVLWLPAAWLWPNGMVLLIGPAKIFLSVACTAIFAQYNGRWELSRGMQGLRLPAPLILIIDQTLYYVVIMARLGRSLFRSLEKRTVGWDRQPRSALSGIAGTTFLRTWRQARTTVQAMECRCFDGSFRPMREGAE